jgi:16S rRNA processing protein RimM
MSQQSPARVTLARIVRPRGRKGEVAAELLTDFPERLTRLKEVWLAGTGLRGRGSPQDARVRVRACWISTSRGGQAIFHFEGCDSISQAEELVGLEVQVPFQECATLSAGRYYISDLVGCEVWERRSSGSVGRDAAAGGNPERLGTVRDVQLPGGGTPLLVVESPGGEVLIPLAEEICVRVDPASRRIEVILPEGLRELNY